MFFRKKNNKTAEFTFENNTDLGVELIAEPMAEGKEIIPKNRGIIDVQYGRDNKLAIHVVLTQDQNRGKLIIQVWNESEGGELTEFRDFSD